MVLYATDSKIMKFKKRFMNYYRTYTQFISLILTKSVTFYSCFTCVVPYFVTIVPAEPRV